MSSGEMLGLRYAGPAHFHGRFLGELPTRYRAGMSAVPVAVAAIRWHPDVYRSDGRVRGSGAPSARTLGRASVRHSARDESEDGMRGSDEQG